MIVTGKALGSRRPLFADWSIPIPPDDANGDGDGGLTLRDLIERIVVQQVSLFRKRQHDRQFLRALTAAEISDAVDRGKVDLGGSEVPIQNVDEEQAIHNAIQAFEDGIYLVVIDEQEQKDLDKQIFLNAESRITFIRLTMLSGG
ncbi:hypothetical protein [Rosistilla oblonga]|uniref:hypothetical protein n=1 Tax=Rosistilla oblonga TaxID=2527990 RepID=UPI003A976E7E